MQKRKQSTSDIQLVNRCNVKVRFNEVDSLKIVWHGEYVKYMEDGRESFGLDYPGLRYMDIYEAGFTAPVVDLHISYKNPLIYGDTAIIETKYIYTPAAKIIFEFSIYRASDNQLVAEGSSIQVFLDKQGELMLVNPEFYLNWQRRWLVRM
ncbi:MAG: acyl-CoA thioesterase [Rikenellaceae bacterium]|nr:acyl-CoA thioesterase [Rikenellaceae bacterium]